MSQSKFLHESKLLGKLAGPIVIGQIGQNLITLADTVMVGSLGPAALGASAFAGSVFIIFYIFGVGTLSPLTALFARAHGQENHPYGGTLLHHSVAVALALGGFLMVLLYLLLPQMAIFGQTTEVLTLGTSFFEIIIWSVIPSLLHQAYKQFTDGIGKTQVAMFVMIFGVIFNIFGNYVLIHGHYGFPQLGLDGAAYATLISRILMAALLIAYVHLNPNFKHYFTERWSHRFDHFLLKNILRLGIPNGLTFLFEVGAFASAAIMMGWYGAMPLAAHQITLSLASTSFLITLGIGIAASIRVGYEQGRGSHVLARYAGFTAIKLGATYMSLCALGFFFLRNWFPTLYVSDPDVIFWAAKFFVIVAIFEISDGIQAVAIGALRGMRDTKWPSIIAFISYWILGLPSGYLLSFHFGMGPLGIWIGLLIGLTVAAVALTWRFHILSRHHVSITRS